MKYRMIFALVIGLSISASAQSIYAAEEQPNQEDATVVGACMVQKFQEHKPAIPDATIEKCSAADVSETPKCLGIGDAEYKDIVKLCLTQLIKAKCVAGKMKVPLIKYAECGYENDPVACYKKLGYTLDQIVKLSTDCDKK